MATRPTDLHRVYIQSILARRWMKEDLALEMYKRAIGAVQGMFFLRPYLALTIADYPLRDIS
jgi:hypothetical protein